MQRSPLAHTPLKSHRAIRLQCAVIKTLPLLVRHLSERQMEQRPRDTESKQSGFNVKGKSIDVNFQVADVPRATIAVRDLTAMGCEVEFSKNGACILTGGRRWDRGAVSSS